MIKVELRWSCGDKTLPSIVHHLILLLLALLMSSLMKLLCRLIFRVSSSILSLFEALWLILDPLFHLLLGSILKLLVMRLQRKSGLLSWIGESHANTFLADRFWTRCSLLRLVVLFVMMLRDRDHQILHSYMYSTKCLVFCALISQLLFFELILNIAQIFLSSFQS